MSTTSNSLSENPSSFKIPRTVEISFLVVTIAWLILIQFYQWPTLVNGGFDNRDCAAFVLSGEMLRTGHTPYIDFWDQKPPMIYIINAFGLTISGGKTLGPWFISLFTLVSTLLISHLTLRKYFGTLAALLGSLVFAASFIGVYAGGNLTESYALPLQWLTLLLFQRWYKEAKANTWIFGILIGIITAISFGLRQNLIGTQVAISATVILFLVFNKQFREIFKFVIGGLSGFIIMAMAIIIWIDLSGGISAVEAFWEYAFVYNFSFKIASSLFAKFIAHLTAFDYVPILGLAVISAIYHLVRLIRGNSIYKTDAFFLLLAIWLPVETIFVTVSGHAFNHYYLAFLPVCSTLAAFTTIQILDKRDQPKRIKNLWILLVVLILAVTAVKHRTKIIRNLENDRVRQVAETVEIIKQNSDSYDTIFSWGVMADIYYLSGRKPASHYTLVYPLLAPGYTDSSTVRKLISELNKSKPELIIDASNKNRQVPSLEKWDPSIVINGEPVHPALKDFYDFIHSNYMISETAGEWDWQVWKRIGKEEPNEIIGSTAPLERF